MQSVVQKTHEYAGSWLGQGNPADYIPELAKANRNHLAVAITDKDGNVFSYGDSKVKFTIQSITKVILLATAIEDSGFETVFTRVGMEPTGDPFNSIIRLETGNTHRPLNPLINAGAIAVTSCISGNTPTERFERVLETARGILGRTDVTYDNNVYLSESETGDRNRALAYMMRSGKTFEDNVDELLEVYFKACSILADCEDISKIGAVLANNGVSPFTGKAVIEPFTVKCIRSLMTTCGMYDASGEFALRVGVPAKSGVGGGIMATAPKRMGIGVWSPCLDPKGNSYCGIKAMEFLSQALDLSIF